MPVLQRLLGPLDKKNQPCYHRQQWQSADGELLKRAAVKLKVEVPGVTYVAVLDGRKWVICGTNVGHWSCSGHRDKGGFKPSCKHIEWAQGKKPEVHRPQSLYPASPGDPDRGWAAIRPETPLPDPGEETALVCVECKLEHPRRLSPSEFQPCSDRSHTRKKVHMCTKACDFRPCMKGPGKYITPITYPTTGGPAELLDVSIRGYFSQCPPASGPPCKTRWGRRVQSKFTVLNGHFVVRVDFCIWRCELGCHTLRPQLPDPVYFDAHHKLMATHHVLDDAKKDLIIGKSFQSIWWRHNGKTVRQIGEFGCLCLKEFFESETSALS